MIYKKNQSLILIKSIKNQVIINNKENQATLISHHNK